MGYCKMKVLNFDNNIHVYNMLWKGFWKKNFQELKMLYFKAVTVGSNGNL